MQEKQIPSTVSYYSAFIDTFFKKILSLEVYFTKLILLMKFKTLNLTTTFPSQNNPSP